jgi:hypothetical protein
MLLTNYTTNRDETLTTTGAGYNANHMESSLAATTDVLTYLSTQVAHLGKHSHTKNDTITDLTAKLATANAAPKAYCDANCNNKCNNN